MAAKDGADHEVAPELERTPSLPTEDNVSELSLYEKKCLLINHEIDSNGMGRYQVRTFLVPVASTAPAYSL